MFVFIMTDLILYEIVKNQVSGVKLHYSTNKRMKVKYIKTWKV